MASGNPITALAASNFNPVSGMEPVVMEQFQVPDSCVGLITGRDDENIINMQNETGCKIQMSQNNTGIQMRDCSLTGTILAIGKAKRCLESIIEKSGGNSSSMIDGSSSSMNNNVVSSPTSGMGGGATAMNFPSGGKMVTIEMQIPDTKCGIIIGKDGETIKQLQKRAQVEMVMIEENNQMTSGYKPLRIIGEPDKIEAAKRLVEEVMYSKDDGPPLSMNGASVGEVIVPRSTVGAIIGRNGETIRRLRLISDAKIYFKPDTNAHARSVYIVGSPDQIYRVTSMITDLVSRAISRDKNGDMRMMDADSDEDAEVPCDQI